MNLFRKRKKRSELLRILLYALDRERIKMIKSELKTTMIEDGYVFDLSKSQPNPFAKMIREQGYTIIVKPEQPATPEKTHAKKAAKV